MSKLRITIILNTLLLATSTLADTGSDYQSSMQFIQSKQLGAQLTKSINANNIPIKPNNSPQQANYYHNPDSIASDAATAVSQPKSTGNIIQNDALVRPKFTVNKESNEIKTGLLIEKNATAIAKGTYKDCNKKKISKIVYTKKMCTVSKPIDFSCTRTLDVFVKSKNQPVNKTENLAGKVSVTGSSTGVIHVDAKKGVLQSLSMHIRDGSNPWSCHRNYTLSMNNHIIANSEVNCGRRLGDLQFNFNEKHIAFDNHQIIFILSARLSGSFSGNAIIVVGKMKHTLTDHWVSTCIDLPAACHKTSRCINKKETKTISGVAVTRSCWQYQDSYTCGSKQDLSTCTDMIADGCSQIGSTCSDLSNEFCDQYTQTWSCPNKKVIGQGIACGSHFYCMDGNCQKTKNEKNKYFGQSISRLAAANNAASDVKTQEKTKKVKPSDIRIFSGEIAECRVDAVGFSDCCANTGWGQGILAHCSDAEKHLGHAKEKGVVLATGRYCHNHVLDVCTEHRKTYCIFPSKLALDVELARQAQLGNSFGTGKSTHCTGISPSEMQKIDFSQIDFRNVIDDIKGRKNLPNFENIEKEIAKRIADKSKLPHQSPYSQGGL